MPTFIEMSICNGSRPAGVVGLHHNLRSEITGALLRDRRIPRFLVAPTGYGKTTCAYEYAQVVFGFEHVFWIRGDSPCFLRDLDEGTLAAQMRAVDSAAKLAVFDDVPSLDPARTEAFDELLRELIDEGIEVIVTCVPSVDTVSARHADKILLDANALLASDDEVEIERMRGNLSGEAAQGLSVPRRAACLLWGERGCEQILKGIALEELPGELELAVFCVLALGHGRIDDLRAMIPESRLHEDASYIACMFPYLGMDMDAGTFEALEVDMADVLAHSKLSPSALGRASVGGDRDALAMDLADVLLAQGNGRRAVDLLRTLGTRAAQAKWVASHGWGLLLNGFPLSVETLASRGMPGDGCMPETLLALRSWALAMLGDDEASEKVATRVVGSSQARWSDIAAAALSRRLRARKGSEEDDGGPQRLGLAKAAALRGAVTDGEGGEPGALRTVSTIDWGMLMDLERTHLDGEECTAGYVAGFAEACELLISDGSGNDGLRNALLISGSWFLEGECAQVFGMGRGGTSAREMTLIEAVAPVVRGLSAQLESASTEGQMTWPECVAVNALQTALDAYPYSFDEVVPPKLVASARSSAVKLLMQVDEHRQGKSSREEARGEYELTHDDMFRERQRPASKVASLRVATPSLMLSLFGGIEAWVGSDKSDPRQIKRKNAKVALAMLALNRGREVTKEKLASLLWPDVTAEAGRQNLYVVWAYLKKVLKVGSSCPYLISSQTGYKLDARFVTCDMQLFEELCKDLLFGRNDKDVWEELYEKVSGDFAEDLLPEVSDNAYINSVRIRLRTQLVDGLVEASSRMWRAGETRGAIWFAREALRRDHSREDAYIALMEAQISSNQRGAALDTYFECRRYLSEELGIDPSKRVVELYRSVIETEEDF